ncbi:MAG: hypothetical protein IPH85_08705 [Ignavibacteria bacterium]|nr:hypothetical protein [Ignavibacteria bacterium]MBK7185992.1 hypothetical protein [Ignavibacteria bacterium]
MRHLVEFIYSFIALPAMWLGMHLLAMVNSKMNRRVVQEAPSQQALAASTKRAHRIHFHAASMGELEQCVPVMDEIRGSGQDVELTVSCSSPSGFDHAQRLSGLTGASYLPLDTRRNVRRFLDAARPDLIVIDRYDLWPHFISAASKRRIPIHVINATMPSAGRSLVLRSWMRHVYSQVRTITAVSASHAEQLEVFMRREIQYKPDTRRDRVLSKKKDVNDQFSYLQREGIVTIVAGSTWPPDEVLLISALSTLKDPDLRIVIVPHEPTEATLSRIEKAIPVTRLSAATSETAGHIVVDSIGKLLGLYSIADAALVGGGHGVGVHSVTEPAGYFIPIACGPHIERSDEASTLQHGMALTVVTNVGDVVEWITDVVKNANALNIIKDELRTFILANTGASEDYAAMILEEINVLQQRSS